MSRLDESYDNVANAQLALTEKVGKALRDNVTVIIVILTIVINLAARLFDTQLQNPFNAVFFADLFQSVTTTVFTYSVFLPYAEKREKSQPVFVENAKRWSSISGRVRSTMSVRFEAYCRERTEAEREERRRAIICNNTLIPYKTYEECYRTMSASKLRELVKRGELSRKNARGIKKANRLIYVRPIKPLIILCGVRASSINDAGRDVISPSSIAAFTNPLITISFNVVMGMITGKWIGVESTQVIVEMLFSAMSIIIASFSGYSAGVKSARKDHDKIKGRIFFLERFIESAEVSNQDAS